jgi:hypothetical protein
MRDHKPLLWGNLAKKCQAYSWSNADRNLKA